MDEILHHPLFQRLERAWRGRVLTRARAGAAASSAARAVRSRRARRGELRLRGEHRRPRELLAARGEARIRRSRGVS
ncbi:hypothetical protein [Sorangium sp. So ce327]|uniref:hypothetical protein n=1 Tax=Sorangium sp. So ce327 TaxID=3133301 RepID=UPI003F60017F